MKYVKSAKGFGLGKIHIDGSRHNGAAVQMPPCYRQRLQFNASLIMMLPAIVLFFLIIPPQSRPSTVWFSQKGKPEEDSAHQWSSVLQAGPWVFQIRENTDARCSHPNSLGEKRSWDSLNAFQITPNNILASSELLFKAWNVTNFNFV